MNKNHGVILRSLAVSSLLEPLMYVSFSWVFAYLMLLGLDAKDFVIIAFYKFGAVLVGLTLLYRILFRKLLMKRELLYRINLFSKKAREIDQQILVLLHEDFADAAKNNWDLALGKQRGDWQKRYEDRDKKLVQLYEQSIAFMDKELLLVPLLDYFRK